MEITIETIDSKKVILISADESLDISAYFTFNEAASIAKNSSVDTSIFIDLTKTKYLFESGQAMLSTLHKMVGTSKKPIYLTNVGPEVKQQLEQASMPSTMILSYQ